MHYRYKLILVGLCFLLSLSACNKYKSFQEEIEVLNAQYAEQWQSALNLKSKVDEASMQQAQKPYDEQFNEISKKWSKVGQEEKQSYHLDLQAEAKKANEKYCQELINIPFQNERKNLRKSWDEKYGYQLRMAARFNDTMTGREIGSIIGEESALLAVKYIELAESKQCPFASIDQVATVSQDIAESFFYKHLGTSIF